MSETEASEYREQPALADIAAKRARLDAIWRTYMNDGSRDAAVICEAALLGVAVHDSLLARVTALEAARDICSGHAYERCGCTCHNAELAAALLETEPIHA